VNTYRHLAERGIPPLHRLPRDVWSYRVRRLKVANLSTQSRLARVGLDPPTPGRTGWPAYQDVGETLWKEGRRGILAPSAARADGLALRLFVGDPTVVPVEPVAPPRVVTEPPVPPTGMRT
jgi:hypothetical protein